MKLRSGTILEYKPSKIKKIPLPSVVEQVLNEDLKDLKTLLTNNPNIAIELVRVITTTTNVDDRFEISSIIKSTFSNDIDTSELQAVCGSLFRLILGNNDIYEDNKIQPIYHDLIQEKILKAFDLDVPSLGQIEENNSF